MQLSFPSIRTAASLFLLSFFIHSYLDRRYLSPSSCSMSYMSPRYQLVPPDYLYQWFLKHPVNTSSSITSIPVGPNPLTPFIPKYTDHELERLHHHYQVYLYREITRENFVPNITAEPIDFASTALPILFLHGSAGSYRQGRSLAGLLAQLYPLAQRAYQFGNHPQDEVRASIPSTSTHPTSSLLPFHVYLVDFKEEWSAFASRLLLDQATFLNTLLHWLQARYQVIHVPIVAHSMGGVVARLAVGLPRYPAWSLQHLLTLSTPHAQAPLPLEPTLTSLAHALNAFWQSHLPHPIGLVSISGGFMDRQVSPLFTSVTSTCALNSTTNNTSNSTRTLSSGPREPGFCHQYITPNVPGVAASCDHLAIAWCRELLVLVGHVMYAAQSAWGSLRLLQETYQFHFQFHWLLTHAKPALPPSVPSWWRGMATSWTWAASTSHVWVWPTGFSWMVYVTTFTMHAPANSHMCIVHYRVGGPEGALGSGNVSAYQTEVERRWQWTQSEFHLHVQPMGECDETVEMRVMVSPDYAGYFRWLVSLHFLDVFLIYPFFHLLALGWVPQVLSLRYLAICTGVVLVLFLSLPTTVPATTSLFNHLQHQGVWAALVFLFVFGSAAFTSVAINKLVSLGIHGLGFLLYAGHHLGSCCMVRVLRKKKSSA